MAYSMEISEGESHYKQQKSRKLVLLACLLTFIVGFVVGILIGHFAIDSGNEAQTSESARQEGCPTTPAPGQDEICIADDILADANPEVSDWIINMLNATNIEENLRNLSAQPHVAGTPMDFEQADMLRQFWLDVGLDKATTTSYNVTLSYPDTSQNNRFILYSETDDKLLESPEDMDYFISQDILPPFFGYAASGNITGAKIVYANYGRDEDFNHLSDTGIDVTGCIILARFGKGGRGSKVRRAEDRGAAGVLLYSDPFDWIPDDVSLDDVYPKSVWIAGNATQRGSIFGGIGDPLTPGFPAIESAYRVEEDRIDGYWPRIPAMPIGYSTAEQLFRLMDGDRVTADGWTGRLNAMYRYSFSNNSTVLGSLEINNKNTEIRPSYNAFGLIRGAVEPDRYVLLGNHRDSWVDGAIDPSSGTAVMMELSRVLGALLKEGKWRPRRSIIFCSWGSEEYALIGSTEWVEENAKVLDFRAVAYINLDIAVTGKYTIRGLGSPPVFSAMYNAAKKVQHPAATDTDGLSVYDDWVEKRPWIDPKDDTNRGVPVIPTPGDGSDYGTFMLRAGITCADFRYDEDFSGNLSFYSLYHTEDETFRAVSELLDPGFVYHATVGKLSGELLRDLSDSLVLPFNMSDYGILLTDYTHNLLNEAETELQDYNINTNFLTEAVSQFIDSAAAFHDAVNAIDRTNPFEIRRVNDQMMLIDRTFLVPEGLPGRPQYKNVVHSTPTRTFPKTSFAGLTDALVELRDNPADSEVVQTLKLHYSVVVFTIQSAAGSLKNATAFLRQ